MSLAIQTHTFPMPSSPPTEMEWENQRELIHQLYIIEDKPLRDIMHILRQGGFRGSAKMYKTRLAKWKFAKNNKLGGMRSALAEIMQQRIIDNDATLQIDGRSFQVKEVERYFRRKGFPQLQDAARHNRLYRDASPANAVTVPEQILITLTTYYVACRDATRCPNDWLSNSSYDPSYMTADFAVLWIDALVFAKEGSYVECRRELDRACSKIEQIVKTQFPNFVHTVLEMIITYTKEGFYDIAVLVLRLVCGMAALYLSCTHPLTSICDKLLQLESGIISNVAQAALKRGANILRQHRAAWGENLIYCISVTIQVPHLPLNALSTLPELENQEVAVNSTLLIEYRQPWPQDLDHALHHKSLIKNTKEISHVL